MKPYSLDLRERVIAMVRAGQVSQAQVAKHFTLSQATVENWWRRWRQTGKVAPKPFAGGPSRTLQPCAALIRKAVKQQPDATLQELCERVYTKTGVRASPSMMCRQLPQLQLPRKKVSARPATRNPARARTAPGLSRQRPRRTPPPRRASQIHR